MFSNLRKLTRDAWTATVIISILPLFLHPSEVEFSIRTILLPLSLGLGVAFGFALNDYFDAPYDAIDSYKSDRNYFVKNIIPRYVLFAIITIILVIFLITAHLFGIKGYLALVILSLFMWQYSAGPMRFKSRIGFDILIHALVMQTSPYIITILLFELEWKAVDFTLMSIFFFSSVAGQLAGQIRDYEIDATSHTSYAIKLGKEDAIVLYRVMITIGIFITIEGILIGVLPPFIAPLLLLGAIHHLTRSISPGKAPKYSRIIDRLLIISAFTYIFAMVVLDLI